MLNIRDFNLSAYCVEQTNRNKDSTHTQVTALGCEVIMSGRAARLTAMQTNAGNLTFPESGKRSVWCEYSADLEARQ